MPTRRRTAVVAGAAVVAVGAAVLLARGRLHGGFSGIADADPRQVGAAAAAFLSSYVCAAASWRAAFGATLGRLDSCARFGTGTILNMIAPAHAGDVFRLGAFAAALPPEGRRRAGATAVAMLGIARLAALGVAVAAGAASGSLPRWLLVAVLPAAVALRVRCASPVAGWTLAAAAFRVVGTMAVLGALGVSDPAAAALAVVPAVALAGLLPLVPGNLGVTTAAVASVLAARGCDLAVATSAGLLFHALELAAGLAFGGAGTGLLAIRSRLALPVRAAAEPG